MAEIDLHLHTTRSDGTLTPTELVRMCAERGLRIISITDHDSTEGLSEAYEAASSFPQLTIIPGIELSTDIPGNEIHVLGYFVDYESPDFQAVLERFREGREDRGRKMVEKLNELGVNISWARVQEISDGGSIGRPHIAQAMVEDGYVQYPKDAFDKYLGRNGVAYVDRLKLTPADAVQILIDNGALPVMAHPTYSASKSGMDEVDSLEETIAELKEAGLVGMEVYYKDYTPEQTERLAALADKLGLIPCGGTDYHAAGNPGEPEPGSVGPP
ncbi:MAG: PHP domain-containing protein, partial [Chloroflexi bacterium]|nr:PHP domain-containing protein [Chloroflexota bacterium]